MRSAERVKKSLLFGVDRTYRRHVQNDANDPKRYHASDYSIVGAGEDRGRNGEAERLGGSEVDDELEARGLFDRQVGELVPGQHFDAHLATWTIEVNYFGTIGSSSSMPDAIWREPSRSDPRCKRSAGPAGRPAAWRSSIRP